MPDYAVSQTFNGVDKVSKVFEAMERAAARYGRNASHSVRQVGAAGDHASQSLRNATKHGYDFAAIVKGILAANAIRGGIGMIGGAVQSAGQQFMDFDDTLVQAAVKFDEIGYSSKNFGQQLTDLKARTMDLITGTRFLPVDAAKAIETLSASGYSVNGAMGGAKSAMQVATAVGEDLAVTVENLSGMMGAFGLRSNDAAVEMKNFARLGDIMTMAANVSNVSVTDLKETMEQAGPVSRAMGIELEEVAAMAAILGNASIKGTEGATALKNIMLSLANKDKAAEIAANIGGLYDSSGKMKKASEIIFQAYSRMNAAGMSKLEIAGKLNELFGLRGIAGATNIATAIEHVRTAMDALENSGGTAAGMSARVSEYSMKVKLAALANAALVKTFDVFNAFSADGKSGIDNLAESIRKFDARPIIDGLKAAGNMLGIVYQILKPFIPLLPYLTAGWLAWRGALLLTALAGGQSLIVFPLIAASLTAGLGPVGAMTTAFSALAASLSAAQIAMVALVGAFAWYQAIKSARTGEDNVISKFAQDIGLVPQIGGPNDGKFIWQDQAPAAPNAVEAAARQQVGFSGQLNIAGAPPGSTFTGSTMGAPPLNVNMLGAQ